MALKRSISFFLLLLLFFQSCHVYKTSSIPINRALESGRVKVMLQDSSVIYVKNIYMVDSEYFALYGKDTIAINNPDEKQYFRLDSDKSNTRTTLLIISAIVIPIVAIVVGAIIAIDKNGLGGNWM